MAMREETATGPSYLARVSELLRDVRIGDPTAGVWEAADFQWWWRKARPTDHVDQFFWVDGTTGRTVGAVTRTDWRGSTALDVIALPSCSDETKRSLWARALAVVADTRQVETMIAQDDELASETLISAGFADTLDRGTSAWLDMTAVPEVVPLAHGYELMSRHDEDGHAHHLDSERNGHDVDRRLRQTSLYRPDLDLLVVDAEGHPAAYGLFWFDPVTKVGFVEPMGTNEPHRRMGLAKHLLTIGIAKLINAGATRVKVNYESDNVASKHLYLGVGFEPVMTTAMFARGHPTSGTIE